MTQNRRGTRMLYGAGLLALGLATAGPAWSLEPTQSTGPGVHQGDDGSMSTKQGGNTGPTTGRNEDSGSATGAVRDPSKAEPPHDKNLGSRPMGSDSNQGASQAERRKRSPSRADK
jgi:hypothetical protein